MSKDVVQVIPFWYSAELLPVANAPSRLPSLQHPDHPLVNVLPLLVNCGRFLGLANRHEVLYRRCKLFCSVRAGDAACKFFREKRGMINTYASMVYR